MAVLFPRREQRAGGDADALGERAMIRNGALLSPPASDGALEGITRGVVFELARELGIPVREESLGTYDLRVADEVILVGTGAGLVAVRSVDGRALASCPGPLFRRLEPAFEALVRREV